MPLSDPTPSLPDMELADRFLKPEYWFQPRQAWRRISRRGPRPDVAEILTPWDLPMRVRPRETVGHIMWHLGVLDLAASEVCWRLLDLGETAVDVGANIGVMTGLLARRAGPTGEVWSFEPHPEISAELAAHIGRWSREGQALARIRAHGMALSAADGEAALHEPGTFEGNHGSATLESVSSESGATNLGGGRSFIVPRRTFDTIFPADRAVGVFKIDVAGHELPVFAGAAGALRARRIRDILFEDHRPLPSPTSERLSAAGYTLFSVGRTFWGPRLTAPSAIGSQPSWLPPNHLATLDPDRALSRCRARGWQVLR